MTYKDRDQKLTEFKVGDIVTVTSDTTWGKASLDGLGGPGARLRVTGVHPNEHNPETGNLSLDGIDYEVGHMLLNPAPTEDQPTERDVREANLARLRKSDLIRALVDAEEQAEDYRARLVATNEAAIATSRQHQSEIEQAGAAQAMEAHRANKAEATRANLQAVVDYAVSIAGKSVRGRILGFIDCLNRSAK